MRIVLTGGGTGGHVYPAISIAEALHGESEYELLYIGSRDGLEARLVAETEIPFRGLTSRKLRKLISPDTILTAGALAKGFMEALSVLRRFKPDLVISTGGYASAAVVMAQASRRGKILIHEENVVIGRTNLWLSRFASKVCVAFEDSVKYFPSGKAIVTGLPVRSELLNLPGKEQARAKMGLKPDKFTILVLGGSLGARRLNEVVADSIPGLRQLPVQVIHQAGEKNFEEAEHRRESTGWNDYHLYAYLNDMLNAYASADIVICRSGASTVAEITAIGIPAIMVPYPYHKDKQQVYNAEYVVRNGGGMVIDDAEINADWLVATIERFVSSPEELKKMAEASRKLGRPQAAQDIANIAVGMI